MDLRRFITFKAVVEEESFLRASQKLCYTQSTVAFRIQQLKQELAIPPFEKIGRRMYLTAAGKSVLPHVYDLAKVMASIRRVARRNGEPSGELRVVTGETLLAYKVPSVLQRFKQRAPKVHLSLQLLNCYSIRDVLLTDEVDLGVLYRVSNDDALTMVELGPQPLALVALVDQTPVDLLRPRQHIPLNFIINEPQCVFRQIFEGALRQRGITMENTIELWGIESTEQYVASNLGVSFLPRFTAEKESKHRTLIELPFSGTPLTTHALCVHHTGKTISPAARVSIQCIQEKQGAR